jgi:hypothetical protein
MHRCRIKKLGSSALKPGTELLPVESGQLILDAYERGPYHW